MGVARALYISFYVFFLIMLAVFIWFILYYSKVPGWIWSFYGIAILIFIFGIFIKEYLMVRVYDSRGIVTNADSVTFWSAFYMIAHIIAFILLIVGIAFTIAYSTIPWWVWVILAVALLLFIIAEIIIAFAPKAWVWAMLLALLALIVFIVGVIFLIIYSNSPWWVWLIIGIALFFAILAFIFESISERETPPKEGECTTRTVIECEEMREVREVREVRVVPVNVVSTGAIDITSLPSSRIPEQIVQ